VARMHARLLPWLVALLFLAAAPVLRAQATLRYQFKQGEKIPYALHVTQKSSTQAMGMDFTLVQRQVIDLTWHILSVDEAGIAKVKLAFDKVKMSLDTAKQTSEVTSDSTEEPKDEFAKVTQPLVKTLSKFQATFRITPLGEIKDVKVPEEILKEFQALPGPGGKAGNEWSEERVQRTLSESGLVLPKVALEKGKTWRNKVSGQSPFGKIGGEVEYSYQGFEARDGKELAKFTMKPELKIVEVRKEPQVELTIKGPDGNGVAYFDNAAGRLVEVTTQQTIEAQAQVNDKMFTQKLELSNSLKLKKAE
jgi:Family of unknown function (DUF6263)